MVQINFAQKTVNVKIVYYGPGMSGKTTNLEVVHQRAPDANRGELTSISTDGDRTLFFDYMPLDLGTVAGMRTSFQLYTVPGQVYYNSTRKLVLQGVDGIIFIADSSASMLDQNLESLRNLEENLNEYGKSLKTLPHVIQWNKRDLPDAMTVAELEQHLNHSGAQTFEGIASSGQGVFPTLKSVAATVLRGILEETAGGKGAGGSPAGAAAAQARPTSTSRPVAPAAAVASAPAPAPSAVQPVATGGQVAASAGVVAPEPGLTLASESAVPQQPMVVPVGEASPAELMQAPVPQAAPVATGGQVAPATTGQSARVRARAQATGSAAARRARQRPAGQNAPVQRAEKKSSSTLMFVVLAAVIGAAVAWGVQNYVL